MKTKDPRVQVTSTGRDNWLLAVHEHGDWVLAPGRYPTQDAALGAVDEVVAEHFGAGRPSDPAPCNSCGHTAPEAEFIPELTPFWVPTGNHVCRDPDACYHRRRDREVPQRSRKR